MPEKTLSQTKDN